MPDDLERALIRVRDAPGLHDHPKWWADDTFADYLRYATEEGTEIWLPTASRSPDAPPARCTIADTKKVSTSASAACSRPIPRS